MKKFLTDEEWAEKNKSYYKPNEYGLESLQSEEEPVVQSIDSRAKKKKLANQNYRAKAKQSKEEFISIEKLVLAAMKAGVPRLEIAIVCNLTRNQVNRAVRRINDKGQS
jgi:hypothetical protein